MKISNYKFYDGQHCINFLTSENLPVELISFDDANSDLADSIKSLIPFIYEICENPSARISEVIICEISFLRNTDSDGVEILGVVITARVKLLNSPGFIHFTTPLRIEALYPGHDDEGELMPDDMIEAILEIEDHLEDFIQGVRAQQELVPVAEEDNA